MPSAPYDVRLVSCSARVVQLEWKHDDSSGDDVTNNDNDDVSVTSSVGGALQFVIEYNTSFQPHTWQV